MKEKKHPNITIITTLLTVAVLVSSCAKASSSKLIEKTSIEMQPVTTQTYTPEPSRTATQTLTSTLEPTPTFTASATPTQISFLDPIRPVDEPIPVYHCYGVPIGIDSAHNGYDYGFNNANPINSPIFSIADGILMYADVDGAIFIDHGVAQHIDGTTSRVISSYWHVVPLESLFINGSTCKQGMTINKGDHIANFCSNCGFNPELELQIISLDPRKTIYMIGYSLRNYMLQQYGTITEGEYTHIDPALIGLECK